MPADCEPTALPSELHPQYTQWSYGVVVSISGCDPLDPGSTPGTANFYLEIRGSIVVSIPACHAGNPGSIPGLGAFLFVKKKKKDEVRIEPGGFFRVAEKNRESAAGSIPSLTQFSEITTCPLLDFTLWGKSSGDLVYSMLPGIQHFLSSDVKSSAPMVYR